MKRRMGILALTALAISALSCGLFFGCGEETTPPPEVTGVTITAEDGGYGKAGALHHVTYTVPEGCEVSTAVTRGEAPATATDFAFREGGYIFYTAGSYTVTVYAAKDGMLGSGSAKVDITAAEAFVGEVALTPLDGETPGSIGALYALSYVAAEGSEVAVSFTKEGAATADARFDAARGTVSFGAAGTYTVTVTATLGETTASGSAQAEISALSAPTVTLAFEKNSVREDEAIALVHTATFAQGDAAATERYTVRYRRDASGEYAEAEADTYSLAGDILLPRVAGQWQVAYTAVGASGLSGEATAEITCSPASLTLKAATSGRHRIQTGQPTEVNYLVTGSADRYDVSFETYGNANVTAEAGDGFSVRVTAAEIDYFTVTVIYTHKINRATKRRVDIDFYAVENLAYAPAWGEDPFDGMPDDVLTSMGHLLYFDAAFCSYAGARVPSVRDAQFEVTENNVTAASGGTGVEILYGASDNEDYPYVIVSNFDNNVATGDFTLKMTLTDPLTGYSAVATKTFNVLATTNNNSAAAAFIQSYVKQHSDFYSMGDMDYSKLCSDCRHNMVLTKTGTIMQRSNPDWALHDSGENADFALMSFATASQNCRLEFSFKLLAPNPASRTAWLGIGLRTGNKDGWAGFFDLHNAGEDLAFTCGLDAAAEAEYASGGELPAARNGATLFVRLDRRMSGTLAVYTVSVKTEAGGAYTEYCRWVYEASESAGNPGAPVAAFQFTHRNGGGCYIVENVSLTAL